MSMEGITKVGLGGSYTVAMFNAARNNVMHSFGTPRNLRIQNVDETTPDEQVGITCDLMRLTDGSSFAFARNLDVVVDVTGTGAGGLDSGSIAADTWYYVWAIGKCALSDGVATNLSAIASTSYETPSMPTGYTFKRLVGCFLTDGTSDIVPFVQNGFIWGYLEKQLAVYDTSPSGWISLDITGLVPISVITQSLNWLWIDSVSGTYEGDGRLRTYGETQQAVVADTDKGEESHLVIWMDLSSGYVDYNISDTVGTIQGRLYIQGFVFPIWQEAF